MESAAEPNPITNLPFEFKGNGFEYFKIWIVNIALTIITLGIYSAWAKVRNKRYFYGNTFIAGSSFEYLANPVSILKGRIIAFVLFIFYTLSIDFLPDAQPIMLLLLLLVSPWLIVRALLFNARNSAYRNIRFNFNKNYSDAIAVYIGCFVLTFITLGFGYPYFAYKQKEFIIKNSKFGQSDFNLTATAGNFYSIYAKAIGLFILIIVLLSLISTLIPDADSTETSAYDAPAELNVDTRGGAKKDIIIEEKVDIEVDVDENTDENIEEELPESEMMTFLPLFILIAYLLFGFIWTYIRTKTTNIIFSNTFADKHQLNSTLKTGRLFWIYVSNLIIVGFTFGLMIPWARIRITKYIFNNLSINAHGNIDEFIADGQLHPNAIGEEISDMFDVDLGL